MAIPPRAIPKFEKQLHWKTTIANGGNELTPTRCQEVGDRGSLIDHSQDMQKMCHFARYLSFFNIGPCANILSRDYGMPRQRWCFHNENDCVGRHLVHAQLRDMTTNQPALELMLRCALGSSSSSQSLHSLGHERTPQWQRLGRIKVLCQHGSST